jgi:hypothetical protein
MNIAYLGNMATQDAYTSLHGPCSDLGGSSPVRPAELDNLELSPVDFVREHDHSDLWNMCIWPEEPPFSVQGEEVIEIESSIEACLGTNTT